MMRFCNVCSIFSVLATLLMVGCGGSSSGPVELTPRPPLSAEEVKANEDYERQQQQSADAYK